MEIARFRLVDYKFTRASFDFVSLNKEGAWNINIEPSGIYDEAHHTYKLTFDFDAKIGEQTSLSVKCVANYEFERSLENNEIPEYFYANSIAIVFPYIRAFISTITLQANMPALVMPTYNLSSLKEKLRDNTRTI
ncbi:MAG: protein-export chaperone SecB [Bacteroidales bacterium]|nr:protein-export chaperone SecB [Bacteroidales bacterium]